MFMPVRGRRFEPCSEVNFFLARSLRDFRNGASGGRRRRNCHTTFRARGRSSANDHMLSQNFRGRAGCREGHHSSKAAVLKAFPPNGGFEQWMIVTQPVFKQL